MKRLNILWLSHFVPYPPKGGAFQRSYNLLKEVAKSNNVYLLAMKHKQSTHPQGNLEEAKKALKIICKEVFVEDISTRTSGLAIYKLMLSSLFSKHPFTVNVFKSEKYKNKIKTLIKEFDFDLIHFDTISLAEYFECTGSAPKALTHHDIESSKMTRRMKNEINLFKKGYLFLEAFKIKFYEKKYCNKFDLNIVMSELDKERLREISCNSLIEIIENGVDTEYFSVQYRLNYTKKHNSLIFAGRLDQYANRNGILFFCLEVWPLIKGSMRDLKFIIIGNNPPEKLTKIARNDEQIELLGFVEDVRLYFAESSVCVCPIYDGGGTRVKILDALSMGMPIVSTTIGCEGLDVTPEKDILIADTPREFAQQIERIFRDSKLRKDLSMNARNTAKRVYSWEILGEKMRKLYSGLSN